MECLSHAESVMGQPWNNEIVLWIECIITFLVGGYQWCYDIDF